MATIKMNNEKNGIGIRFNGKPSSSVIESLKTNGFRWSVKQKMWYAKQNAERIAFAEGLGEISSTVRNKVEQDENRNLWEMTRTDGIEDNYALYHLHDTKKIATIIRKHLRARSPMCKWSVTSDYNNVNVRPHCGEIWMCYLTSKDGSIQSGYRPVFILSNDKNNTYSTTLNIIPLTSKMNKRKLPVHVELWSYQQYGLEKPSTLLVEQISTITIECLDRCIGKVSDRETLCNISNAISVQFPVLVNA